ncbi:uncharacterized protein LOC124922152 [Impatiens glandulifera]|uniref:uncharacterized protein LOC124918475 n=1 Tax=Impatiens glandulifera TaxID=253017 RepID=UPI001FB05343|nr:uncharacterized protein LOC124918475 [Impatiens glandulifera]XP_047318837.1 uncharacterized protein LOC124922152 [Impatiens glandulifera]
MATFSALAIGLSFGFGCILLGLVAELYYLLWWKRRVSSRVTEDHHYNNQTITKEPSHHLFCWRKSISLDSDEVTNSVTKTSETIDEHEPDLELGVVGGKDLVIKGFGEEGVECEIMRLHNLCGPTRFLFTIKEETKEDMESDDGKSRSRKRSRTRSLSDILVTIESTTTPLASPLKTQNFDSYNHHGFNPLFEQLTESELNRLRSSPPPKFKFMRDAEDKLMKRLIEEEAERKALKDTQRLAAAFDDDDDEDEDEEEEVHP